MKAMGFGKEVARVEKGECPFCGKAIMEGEFRDGKSAIEHEVSGLCQKCQDHVWDGEL